MRNNWLKSLGLVLLGALLAWFFLRPRPRGPEPLGPQTALQATPLPESPAPRAKARLAIVLDDWGYNTRQLDALGSIEAPLTVAVIPGLPHSRACAEGARTRGKEVIIHVPVEPHGKIPLVEGTLMVGWSPVRVAAQMDAYALTVPGFVGINSHEGSKGSEDPALMGALASWLAGKGGYFLDSVTSPRSLIPSAARAAGLASANRDVFLDNEDDEASIDAQLAKAEALALKRGHAIAIGHARARTLNTLRRLQARWKAEGIEPVFASALMKR